MKPSPPPAATAGTPAERRPGRVVRAFGRQLVVEDAGGQLHPCRLFGKDLRPVCGDEVTFAPGAAGDGQGLVYAIGPRKGVLARWNSSGRTEVMVAHLTRLVVVFAPEPAADLFIVDRYLAAATLAGLSAVVVCTKADLLVTGAPHAAAAPALTAALADYARIGYPAFLVDTADVATLGGLAAALASGTSALVGQSGVGKSSLLNLLAPAAAAAVGELSAASEEGRHTTTAAALHHLPHGGALIDSPGVRDFAPPVPEPRHAREGFLEIDALGAQCRFQDCLHREEPGCAVRAAVGDGPEAPVSERRYTSYRRLLNLALDMEARRGRGR
jgi:ribosome biogenesis GTPase / thiamine phosphate phosphatase